jgi:predicted metal-dependent hydrolase
VKRLKVTSPEQLSLVLDSTEPVATHSPPAADDTRARRVQVGHETLVYRLRRARRRSIGFQIDDHGLTISAPRWVPLREIEAAIAEKRRWILRKQQEWHEWRIRRRLPTLRFTDGAALPYLGGHVLLRLGADLAAHRHANEELHLALPPEAGELQVRDAVQAWLQAEARRVFDARLARFGDRISPRFSGWTLSSARTQWGSCTHDGRVRLSWRLIHFSLPVIDYVVAHELAHLHELNHSPRFWDAVAQLLPGFEAARDEIRRFDVASLPL